MPCQMKINNGHSRNHLQRPQLPPNQREKQSQRLVPSQQAPQHPQNRKGRPRANRRQKERLRKLNQSWRRWSRGRRRKETAPSKKRPAASVKRPACSSEKDKQRKKLAVYKYQYKTGKWGFKVNGKEVVGATCQNDASFNAFIQNLSTKVFLLNFSW